MGMNGPVLIVDDDEQILTLTQEILTASGFTVRGFTDPVKALTSLTVDGAAAIISDIDMPGMSGIEFGQKVRAIDEHIPIVFLTGFSTLEYAKEAIRIGASEFIEKPVKNIHALIEVVRTAIRKREERKALETVHDLYRALVRPGESIQPADVFYDLQEFTIKGWAKLIEHKDEETGNHLMRIARYTELLANELSATTAFSGYLSHEYIQDLKLGSILHDIGKSSVPDTILMKPGKLTAEEFVIIKSHVTVGGSFLETCLTEWKNKYPDMKCYFNLGSQIAKFHHERWDGSGYAAGLARTDIPLSARIVAIADVYDALTSERPYKKAWPHADAVAEIIRSSETHFDPSIVSVFLSISPKFAEIRSTFN
ncbi:MAG: HD domain-containing phosphohydrolase [Spirochaetota bacterium]